MLLLEVCFKKKMRPFLKSDIREARDLKKKNGHTAPLCKGNEANQKLLTFLDEPLRHCTVPSLDEPLLHHT